MAFYSVGAKNTMLDAITVNQLKLHTDNPGAAGTLNEYSGGGYAAKAAIFDPASESARVLNTQVTFNGVAAATVAWLSFWNSSGSVFQGAAALSGDTAFNSAGELNITTDTKFEITNP